MVRRIGIAGAALFVVMVALAAARATREIDLAVTIGLQSRTSELLDLLVNWHTLLGQLATTLGVAAILALFVWRRYGGWAWVGPLLILVTGAIELAFKYALVHPGPPEQFDRAFIDVLRPRLEVPSSLPSGHLARLTFFTVFLAGLFPSRGAWVAAVAFVSLSVFARVYIGDHWLSDALAGLGLGAAVGAAAVAWVERTRSVTS